MDFLIHFLCLIGGVLMQSTVNMMMVEYEENVNLVAKINTELCKQFGLEHHLTDFSANLVNALNQYKRFVPLMNNKEANALSYVFGVAIVVIAAFPMALLGIIPQSIVADVAEADSVVTGEKREGIRQRL